VVVADAFDSSASTLDGSGPVRQLAEALSPSFEALRIVPVMNAAEACAPSALRNVVLVASRRA
jgi:hypothetical protein